MVRIGFCPRNSYREGLMPQLPPCNPKDIGDNTGEVVPGVLQAGSGHQSVSRNGSLEGLSP